MKKNKFQYEQKTDMDNMICFFFAILIHEREKEPEKKLSKCSRFFFKKMER